MANYYLNKDGSITKKKMPDDRNQARAKINQEQARKELMQARQQQSNYIQKERQNILRQPQQAPQDIFQNRRVQLEDLTRKNITKTQTPFDFRRPNSFQEQASRNAQSLREASSTNKAKMLKEITSEKQNKYNYASYLRNKQQVEEQSETNILDKVLNPIVSGPMDLIDPTRLTGTLDYYDEQGNHSYLPSKRELKRQKVREDSKGLMGVYNDVAYNMTKAVSSQIIDSFLPGAGKTLYYGDIVNNSLDEAKKQGFSSGEAIAYAGATGIIAATLDNVLDTFGGLSNATKGKLPTLTQGMDKFFNKVLKNKTASVVLSNISREALSEFTEEYADNIAKYIINADASDADSFLDMLSQTWGDATYSALIGGISGTVGSVMERESIDTQERKKALQDYKKTLENIKPQTPIEAQFKNDELNKVDDKLLELSEEDRQAVSKYSDELSQVREEQGIQTAPNRTEQVNETTQKAKIEENVSKEEPPKAKVSKPLNFRDALTDYEVEDILQQINTYNQEQIKKNLITTERVMESYNNNKINLAYATLAMKSNNASDFSQTRAENYFKLLSKKLSDTDKSYVYRNLDKTNYKLAEMAEKYFAPTEKQETSKKEIKPQNIKETVNYVNDEIGLSRSEQRDLTEKLKPYETMSKEQLTNKKTQDEIKNIISEYKTRSVAYDNADIRDIKKYIRNTNIKISDNLKNQITDYNDFRKSNFGNLKLTKEGTPIDVFWEELKETYPQFANEEVNGETDILEKLADFVKQDNVMTENYTIPDDEIDKLSTQVFNSLIRNAESETEMPTYEISNDYDESSNIQTTREAAKKINLPNKTTNNTVKDIRAVENTKNQTPVENLNNNDITINGNTISTNLNERMVDDVLKITNIDDKPKTITISDKENEFKVKKPSPELASKDMSEQVGKMIDNISEKEKKEIYRETQKKNTVFAKGQEYAKNTGDTKLINDMKSVEDQAYYNQLDIKANLLNNIIDTYKDVDAKSEHFDSEYLRLSAGTLDGSKIEVSNEVIAEGQGLAVYYLDKHMTKEATDVLLKLGKLGTASGQASAQFNAMYQYTPYGIYTQTVMSMNEAYQKAADRKGPMWAARNNPETNLDSKYRLTQEQTDYILKEASDLFELHGKDFKEYSIRKGKLQNYIGDLIPHGFSEGLGNWVRSSLLLGTRTVFKNYGSNVIDTAYHATNKINYTIYDSAISKLFGTNVRVAGISLDGSKAGLKAGVETSIQSVKDIIKGTNTTEFSNRYSDASTSRENITKDFFDTMPARYQTKIKPLNAAANWVSQLSNNTMTWGDAKFAAASYEDNRITLRKMNALEQYHKDSSKPIIYNAKTDSSGTTHIDYINTNGQYSYAITTENLNSFAKQNEMSLLKNTDKIDKLALDYAESRTYTGDTSFSKLTSSLISALDRGAAKVPVLKQTGIKPSNFIIPFSKIGSNLCYKLYRGSLLSIPSLSNAAQQFKLEADAGEVSMKTQYELVSRLGDLTTGTIFYAITGSLAKAAFDNLKGDDDDDEQSKVKKFMQSIFGKDKYTFKVGDYNFSFDVGGNLTNMLKLSLDLKETTEKEDATFKDYTETFFKDVLSEWTVSNVTDLFNEQYNSNVFDNILQTIARVPSMTIPSFMKDVAMNIDNFTERSVWDEDLGTYAINNIKAKIAPIGFLKPISRETLPEKTDSWGNTMKNGTTLLTQVWNTYLVGNQIKEDKSDDVSKELMNVYLTTQKTSVIPNVSKSSFSYNKTEYKLTDEEERQYLKKYAGVAHEKLDKLFGSQLYRESDTETKLKYIDEVYTYANDEAKREYLKTKGVEYYNYGKQVLILGKDTEFKQSTVLDAVDNNLSYESARAYQKDSQKFKVYNSFGGYDSYTAISNNIDDIQTTYSKENGYTTNQRKDRVVSYVNSLKNMSAVQKAILIKMKYPSLYKSYNEQIKQYLRKQNIDEDTYNSMLSKMKISN